jgi:hypothetical protein
VVHGRNRQTPVYLFDDSLPIGQGTHGLAEFLLGKPAKNRFFQARWILVKSKNDYNSIGGARKEYPVCTAGKKTECFTGNKY